MISLGPLRTGTPLHMRVLQALILSATWSSLLGKRVIQIAKPVGAVVRFQCDQEDTSKIVWLKEADEKFNTGTKILYAGNTVFNEVDRNKFTFGEKSDSVTLVIRDLQVEDAGSYTCGNQVQALLTVITAPACSPTPPLPDIEEEKEMQLSCAVQSRGPSKPTLSWLVGNVSVSGNSMYNKDITSRVLKFKPRYKQHGQHVRCIVIHEAWDPSDPRLLCDYSLKLLIKPKMVCPSVQTVEEKDPVHKVFCSIVANPLPEYGSMSWRFPHGEVVHISASEMNQKALKTPYGINVSLVLDHLTTAMPAQSLTLRIPDAVQSTTYIKKDITVQMAFGPTIICPEKLVVSVDAKKNKQKHKIKCDILVNPVPPMENITWDIGGGAVPQDEEMISTFAGGVRIEHPVEDRLFDGMEVVDVTLRIASRGGAPPVSKVIRLVASGRGADRKSPASTLVGTWFLRHAGLLVVLAVVLLIVVLVLVLCALVFKKGMLRNESNSDYSMSRYKYGPSPVVAAIADLEGTFLQGRSRDDLNIDKKASFTFYSGNDSARTLDRINANQDKLKRCLAGTPLSQGPTSPSSGTGSATPSGAIHHSATLTPGATRRHLALHQHQQQQLMAAAAAEPSVEQQHQYGFAKLASALYLKDVDQDGFLEVEESLSVIHSYSKVYKLDFTDLDINEALMRCSNGIQVDIETMLRLLALAAQGQTMGSRGSGGTPATGMSNDRSSTPGSAGGCPSSSMATGVSNASSSTSGSRQIAAHIHTPSPSIAAAPQQSNDQKPLAWDGSEYAASKPQKQSTTAASAVAAAVAALANNDSGISTEWQEDAPASDSSSPRDAGRGEGGGARLQNSVNTLDLMTEKKELRRMRKKTEKTTASAAASAATTGDPPPPPPPHSRPTPLPPTPPPHLPPPNPPPHQNLPSSLEPPSPPARMPPPPPPPQPPDRPDRLDGGSESPSPARRATGVSPAVYV